MMTKPILDVGKAIGLYSDDLVMYGTTKAKIKAPFNQGEPTGKLVLMTAITPTVAGEGKTTMAIALHDALWARGQQSLLCLREPSLGPVFGIKGGATGGGKAKLFPSDDINLHFTGDLHALTSSINLVAAVIDNHIYQGNVLQIDPKRVTWKRALDVNDRSLRRIKINLGKNDGQPRYDEFQITVASEMMAIMCLSLNPEDFKNRIKEAIIGYNFAGDPVRLGALEIEDAIYRLMEVALLPNLVQTLEGNPALVHGGPFANIAHGCNSLIATRYALSRAPIVVTEAGFASELGAEKFCDIKCRIGGIKPDLAVVVATIKALKLHGGVSEADLKIENIEALKNGFQNLVQHIENMNKFGLQVLVALNVFNDDFTNEINEFTRFMLESQYEYSLVTSVKDGSIGGVDFADKVVKMLDHKNDFHFLYDTENNIKTKIAKIARELYRADGVKYTKRALKELANIVSLGFGHLPICMAKTPLSFSDNPTLKNAPRGFKITIREFRLSAGAGFIVALTGKVLTMPGLPKVPAAVRMKEVR